MPQKQEEEVKKRVTKETTKRETKQPPQEEEAGGLPQPPDILFAGSGAGWQDILKERFVDLCFGAFMLFLIVMYVYQRFDFDPAIGAETLDQHPTVKKGIAMMLALILGSVTRKAGGAAAAFMDQTIGMLIGLVNLARRFR